MRQSSCRRPSGANDPPPLLARWARPHNAVLRQQRAQLAPAAAAATSAAWWSSRRMRMAWMTATGGRRDCSAGHLAWLAGERGLRDLSTMQTTEWVQPCALPQRLSPSTHERNPAAAAPLSGGASTARRLSRATRTRAATTSAHTRAATCASRWSAAAATRACWSPRTRATTPTTPQPPAAACVRAGGEAASWRGGRLTVSPTTPGWAVWRCQPWSFACHPVESGNWSITPAFRCLMAPSSLLCASPRPVCNISLP